MCRCVRARVTGSFICLCVYVCARARVCVCVCVCVSPSGPHHEFQPGRHRQGSAACAHPVLPALLFGGRVRATKSWLFVRARQVLDSARGVRRAAAARGAFGHRPAQINLDGLCRNISGHCLRHSFAPGGFCNACVLHFAVCAGQRSSPSRMVFGALRPLGRYAPNCIRGAPPQMVFGALRPKSYSGRSAPNCIRGASPKLYSGRPTPNGIRGAPLQIVFVELPPKLYSGRPVPNCIRGAPPPTHTKWNSGRSAPNGIRGAPYCGRSAPNGIRGAPPQIV